jgi:hypothetical protein
MCWSERHIIEKSEKENSSRADSGKRPFHTYIIETQDATHKTKIGRFASGNVDDRIKTLQTGCPNDLILLAIIPHNVERLMHARLDEWRIYRTSAKAVTTTSEWFLPNIPLARFLLDHMEYWIDIERTAHYIAHAAMSLAVST